jgi:hypothetical protein
MKEQLIHHESYEAATTLLEVVACALHQASHHIFFNECYATIKKAFENYEIRCLKEALRLEPSAN